MALQLYRLGQVNGMTFADLDSYYTKTNLSELERRFKDPGFLSRVFRKQGMLYGAFRNFRNIPDQDDYRIVLILRDPRDVICSTYYSRRYGHGLINKELYYNRKAIQHVDIDTYAIETIERFKPLYQEYMDHLIGKDHVLFIRYEDLIMEFDVHLKAICEHTGLTDDSSMIEQIIQESDFSVKEEDVYKHKRQVTPGDHLKKLKPETIKKLNEAFAEPVARYWSGSSS